MSVTGSQTEKNLLIAFAGESQARNRYDYYAGIARKEKLIQIANIFEETARQETQHAKRFFRFLDRNDLLEITTEFPAGILSNTLDNLKAAAAGENEEWTHMYPHFADVARQEGFADIGAAFDEICLAEKHHEARYLAMAEALELGKLFVRDEVVIWKCQNCGYIHEAKAAPEMCPACLHPQGYFQVLTEDWADRLS